MIIKHLTDDNFCVILEEMQKALDREENPTRRAKIREALRNLIEDILEA